MYEASIIKIKPKSKYVELWLQIKVVIVIGHIKLRWISGRFDKNKNRSSKKDL